MARVLIVALALLLTAAFVVTSRPCGECRREIWKEVLWEAGERSFDYCAHYHAARRGEMSAMARFLSFSQHTDAASALGHGCAIVRVLQEAGDESVAASIRGLPPRIREDVGRLLEAGVDYGLGLPIKETERFFPRSYAAAKP